ncbi:MAG: hypothetical protein ACTHKS_08225 [Gaiellaceae bacterium]
MFGRSRYTKVIDAQLELFVSEHRDVIQETRQRLELYNRSDRSEAEELYGDYVDAVDTGTEILADMRDHYAATLDDADDYVADFNRAVTKRLPEFGRELEDR